MSTMVRNVPTARPNIIVTAIDTQNTSCSSGATPRIVVPAARTTGRSRESAASTTAV